MLANFCQPETGSLCSVIIVNNFKERKRRLACLCIKIYRDIYSRQSCCAARPLTPHPPLNPLPAAPPNVSAAVGVAPISEAPPTGSSDIKVLPSIFRKGPSPSLLGAPPLTPCPLLVASPELHPHTATPPHQFRFTPTEIKPRPQQACCSNSVQYSDTTTPFLLPLRVGGSDVGAQYGPTNQITPPHVLLAPPPPSQCATLAGKCNLCPVFFFVCVYVCA